MTSARNMREPGRAVKPVLSVLLVASLVSGVFPVAAAWPPWAGDDSEVGRESSVTIEWLLEHARDDDVVPVDVRDRAEYEAGHLPGARHLDLDPAAWRDGPALFSRIGLSGSERIVFYGGDALSERAALAFWTAEFSGAERAAVLDGGFGVWTTAGGETSTAQVDASPTAWVTAARRDRFASRAYVALSFGVRGREIVDARGRPRWDGEPGSPRSGHVPHSLPLSPQEFLENGALMSPEASRAMLSRFGPRPSSPVDLSWEFIVHGESMGDGALLYYLFRRTGLERVRLYAGGWVEWAEDAGLPVVRIIGARELRERLARERRWFAPDSPPPGFAFFDVRHGSDHARAHIPGSVNLTSRLFADSLEPYLERYWPGLDRGTAPILTYCYGPDCIRSRATSTEAARLGFLVVERLYEGLEGWRAIGGPIVGDEKPSE